MDDITVAFPLDIKLSEATTICHSQHLMQLFMATPLPLAISDDRLGPVQKWAVDLGVDVKQRPLYICGKTGCRNTEVALHICDRQCGRIQAGASTGKAASNLNRP